MKETLPKSVQELILSLREKLKDEPEIVDMFERCYSNTLDTTVKKMEDGSTYVITGDIPAMWLRDSVAQLRPYLVPAQNDPELADLIAGLIRRQFMCINIDPYANAFNEGPNGNCWEKDETDMGCLLYTSHGKQTSRWTCPDSVSSVMEWRLWSRKPQRKIWKACRIMTRVWLLLFADN